MKSGEYPAVLPPSRRRPGAARGGWGRDGRGHSCETARVGAAALRIPGGAGPGSPALRGVLGAVRTRGGAGSSGPGLRGSALAEGRREPPGARAPGRAADEGPRCGAPPESWAASVGPPAGLSVRKEERRERQRTVSPGWMAPCRARRCGRYAAFPERRRTRTVSRSRFSFS